MVTSVSTRTSHIPEFVLANLSCLTTRVPKPPCGNRTTRPQAQSTPKDQKDIEPNRNDVTSHRNVTAIVDLKPELNPVANIRRPRFSFSLCNCQKTDETNPVENLTPRAQTILPETHNPHQTFVRNFRASSSVASSAAALVGERFIVPAPKRSQQANPKKSRFSTSPGNHTTISRSTRPAPPNTKSQPQKSCPNGQNPARLQRRVMVAA